VLHPLAEHDLLLFWAQFALLLLSARGLGHLFRRMGQPAVIGELGAGLLIGPSVFARILPEQATWLFPGTPVQSAPILTVAWIGVALLLVETGFETDLSLLRRLGRQAAAVSIGSLVVPLAMGFAVGWVMPQEIFVGPAGDRFLFAAFLAVALSISALPVVARILTELDLMRRNIAQVTVAAAMANDLVGWILLGTLSGIVASGGLALGQSLLTVVAISAFFTFALTVGQRLTDTALRIARQVSVGATGPLTVTFLVVLIAAVITQAIGVEAVLGAFVAGIVLGRSPYLQREIRRTITLMSTAVFAPIFFASAGVYVDLGAVATPSGILWGTTIIVIATVAKMLGSYLGARAGRMDHHDGVALGIGLNARGAMEIVLATVAFALGVFSQDAYTIIVLMAMATSLAAPPLLRRALRDVEPAGAEAARLEREEILATSVVASTDRALLPTRGGGNALLAAEVLDLLLQPSASITALTVHDPDAPPEECRCDEALDQLVDRFPHRSTERRRLTSSSPAVAILGEAELGYGLVAVGLTEGFRDTHELSEVLRQLIARSSAPLLLVRRGHGGGFGPGLTRRILVPATGMHQGRAAEEVGAILAAQLDARLDLVHVVTRSDRGADTGQRQPVTAGGFGEGSEVAARTVLDQASDRARRFGARVQVSARTGSVTPEALLAAGRDLGADLLVLSARSRAVEGQPFLGHGIEFLLEHAPQTVAAVIFPPEGQGAE
jgi:Kef-type K+ transport system membrane component KefB/nucleotide-binding universal stress UspA family protein